MTSPPRLRGYVTERKIGRGASAEVWQARAVASGARVALKRIPLRDTERLRRAQSEAALLAAFDHPNLIRVHALIPDGDAAVLVLDLAEGGSLADLLAARGRLAPGEVITALAPIAAALQYVHGEGVVHGDVSPANILFTAAGVSLLSDVGVARLTGDDADAESTPAYVDPAVAAGCIPGPQSDIFMLGAVALHALTGAPAWRGETADAVLAQAASAALDDVAQRLAYADVPAAMAAVVARALAIDPQRRGTAADLALDLAHSGEPVAVELAAGRLRSDRAAAQPAARHAASATSVPAPPPTRMVGPRPRPVIPRPAGRRRFLNASWVHRGAVVAGVAAIAVAAAVLHPWSRSERPRAPQA
ncbi:MAG TPA: serine/threonine-protein kinase, partial [Jatrophihabitans sp.]|nr:serine/threonine-protein kinase [Jatrophihabitans sp.]